MELYTDKQKFLKVRIDFTGDFPFTVNPDTPKERKYPSLTELIHPDDIAPITEMFADASFGGGQQMEAHCRFLVDGEYRWFFMSCDMVNGIDDKVNHLGYFEGTMCDVSTYLESAGEDLVYKQFRDKHDIRMDELRHGDIDLQVVLDRQYLISVQKPFENNRLFSGIYNQAGRLICVPKAQRASVKAEDFPYQKKKNIRINHMTAGSWLIGAKTKEELESQLPLFDTMATTVSHMANAFVAIMREMENSQNANKMLSQNVEEQILLNNIYNIIMQSETVIDGLQQTLQLVGEFFNIDRIAVIDTAGKAIRKYSWCKDKGFVDETMSDKELEINERNYATLYADLANYSYSFSDENKNDLAVIGVKSYAAYKLYDAGRFVGLTVYEAKTEDRVWTQRERKQLRNITQIISSMMNSLRAEEKLEESQLKLRRLAFYDSIFNVPNRAKLNKDLSAIIESGKEGSIIAFKITNTRSLSAVNGHTYSDLLVRSVAQYLAKLPVKDIGVYYFTNAIFILNLPGCVGGEAKKLAEALVYRFSKPWSFEGAEHFIYCSMGIAYYPLNGKTAEDVCKAASAAMYRAREFKRNSYTFYSGSLEKSRSFAESLEKKLIESINGGMKGFTIRYQPAFDSEGGVSYCEALVRWNAEPYGSIPNSTLFPLAENLGLSAVIDEWVLEQSCKFCKKVQDGGLTDFKVSVNLAVGELQDTSLIFQVKRALELTDLPAQSLILEIPAKANLNYSDNLNIPSELKKMGVIIAIDGNGTEDISLNMLKSAYIGVINVPKNLLQDTDDDFDRELVNALITLAHCRDIKICIKGIEDEAQLLKASRAGADLVQGYFCSKPLLKDEALKILIGVNCN